MSTATAAWIEHLATAMNVDAIEDLTVGGIDTKGVISYDVSVADFDMTTPVAQSQWIPVDYTALADEGRFALDGGSDLGAIVENSPRLARWIKEVHAGRMPGSVGAALAQHRKQLVDNIIQGKTLYHENAVACGTTGLLGLAFATYEYSKQPMLGCRAVFQNLDLVRDMPYELFNVALAGWSLASLINTRSEVKYGLGYCRTISLDGFVDQMDMHAARKTVDSVVHERTSSMVGTSVDPLVGGAADQKQGMALSLDACRRGVSTVAPNVWDVRAGEVDKTAFPGNL